MKALIAVLLAIIVLLQIRLWVGEGSRTHVRELKARVAEQEAANAEMAARNEALETEVLDLKTGLEAVEERARSELGMIREGETFYHIIE